MSTIKKTTPETKAKGVADRLSDRDREVYERIGHAVDHIPNEAFLTRRAEQRFFGDGAMSIETPEWTYYADEPEDVSAAAKHRRIKLSGEEERELFLRFNYARYRLDGLARAQRKSPTLRRAREMVRWMRRAMNLRATLTTANLPLVLAMAKRTRVPNAEFADLVSEGNMALLRSIEKFDAGRGFKFSTYACRSILKSFNRLATKMGKHYRRFPVEYDPDLEKSDYDVRRHEMQLADSIDSLRQAIERNEAHLTETEQTIVIERFALNREGRKHTLAQVGEMVGLTNERVRQLQKNALAKLRTTLEERYLVA